MLLLKRFWYRYLYHTGWVYFESNCFLVIFLWCVFTSLSEENKLMTTMFFMRRHKNDVHWWKYESNIFCWNNRISWEKQRRAVGIQSLWGWSMIQLLKYVKRRIVLCFLYRKDCGESSFRLRANYHFCWNRILKGL